jgi:hypothetical protein
MGVPRTRWSSDRIAAGLFCVPRRRPISPIYFVEDDPALSLSLIRDSRSTCLDRLVKDGDFPLAKLPGDATEKLCRDYLALSGGDAPRPPSSGARTLRRSAKRRRLPLSFALPTANSSGRAVLTSSMERAVGEGGVIKLHSMHWHICHEMMVPQRFSLFV